MDVSAISGFNPTLSPIDAVFPTSGVTPASPLDSVLPLAGSETSLSSLGTLLGAAENLATAAGVLSTSDTASTQAVSGFVQAYNAVQTGLSTLSQEDPTLGLNLATLRTRLAGAVNSAGSDLAAIGIVVNGDASLTLNARDFQAALDANPDGVTRIFRNDGQGVADQIAALAAGPLSPSGLLQAAAPVLTSPADLVQSLLEPENATQDFGATANLADQFLLAQLAASQQSGSASGNSLLDVLLAQSFAASGNLAALAAQADLAGLI